MCGKNWMACNTNTTRLGSPPRVREKLILRYLVNSFVRITPACAGKTCSHRLGSLLAWDHPRVCGKNAKIRAQRQKVLGSPPRVREKLGVEIPYFDKYRITPACAGKTLKDPNEIKTFLSS